MTKATTWAQRHMTQDKREAEEKEEEDGGGEGRYITHHRDNLCHSMPTRRATSRPRRRNGRHGEDPVCQVRVGTVAN